jgi:hypothetical protein
MQTLFPGYYRLNDDEFARLWKDATFILDANVLLNLYRYPEKAREDLLRALQKVGNRLWIPYHVALEYQRNRQTVIAEQRRRFAEVSRILEDARQDIENELSGLQLKKRHSNINPDSFTRKLSEVIGEFRAELEALEKTHADNIESDELRDRIEGLLSGKIGARPADQNVLEAIYKQGDQRFAALIPPGYLDRKKDKDKQGEEFSYGGLTYKRKFGDLLVWKQIIDHAKSANLKDLIFITDDEKEDWWWTIESNGPKKLGPRPELTEELTREGGVERFFMYSSEKFLEFADAYLKVKVSKDTIAQVTESKEEARQLLTRGTDFLHQINLVEEAVERWLVKQFPKERIHHNERGFPDFIVEGDSSARLGVEVIPVRGRFGVPPMRLETVFRGHYEISMGRLQRCMFIFVIMDDADEHRALRMIHSRLRELPPGVEIQIGRLATTGGRFEFEMLPSLF